MGGAEGDESGHVEAAHTDDIEPRAVGGEAELAGAVVREGSLRLQPDMCQQRAQFGQDAALGDRQDEGLVGGRSEEHTSELQSLMRLSYAVFCLKKKTIARTINIRHTIKRT